MTLTNKQLKSLRPKDKPYKVSDSGSLFALVHPNGSIYWRMNYRFGDKGRTLSMGVYPEVSLRDARDARNEAKKMLRIGLDPSAEKQKLKKESQQSLSNTFDQVSHEWLDVKKLNWRPSHKEKQIGLLKRHLLPHIGTIPINQIDTQTILTALRLVERSGAYETTRRCKQIASQIFKYAITLGYCQTDPTYGLSEVLVKPKTKHYAAITDRKEFGALIRAIDGFKGSLVVEIALKLAPLVFARPGELRHMEWDELDLTNRLWCIPSSKMKMDKPHIVPLASQAIDLIEQIKILSGSYRYVFPGERSRARPMSENALNAALRRLGYNKHHHTAHGFRAAARTLLDEELAQPPHLIEHQLAHNVRDPLGRAYNRTEHLKDRRIMMQRWADYIDSLREGALIISFGAK